jgi:hypothetical protein
LDISSIIEKNKQACVGKIKIKRIWANITLLSDDSSESFLPNKWYIIIWAKAGILGTNGGNACPLDKLHDLAVNIFILLIIGAYFPNIIMILFSIRKTIMIIIILIDSFFLLIYWKT